MINPDYSPADTNPKRKRGSTKKRASLALRANLSARPARQPLASVNNPGIKNRNIWRRNGCTRQVFNLDCFHKRAVDRPQLIIGLSPGFCEDG
jgi:hypothetical protein